MVWWLVADMAAPSTSGFTARRLGAELPLESVTQCASGRAGSKLFSHAGLVLDARELRLERLLESGPRGAAAPDRQPHAAHVLDPRGQRRVERNAGEGEADHPRGVLHARAGRGPVATGEDEPRGAHPDAERRR